MTNYTKKTRTFPLGQGLVLLQESSDRFHILNPLARLIWESVTSGMTPDAVKSLLAKQTGYDEKTVVSLFSAWSSAGLDPSVSHTIRRSQNHYIYWLGGGCIRVESDDGDLLRPLHACLAHLEDRHSGPVAGTLTLCRETHGYTILKDGRKIRCLDSLNDLIVYTVWEMIELGCRIPDRLLVVHGGAVAKDDICFILAGAGGSGKTTLTAGLIASGFTLVADDVLPVDSRNGLLSPIPMSLCLKSTSWTVMDGLYPEWSSLPVYRRFGKRVRFFPPPATAVPDPTHRFRARAIMFPRFLPKCTPQITPLPPYEMLAELIRTNSVIDSWNPKKLEAVTDWLSGLDGFTLTYPDLTSGIELVTRAFTDIQQRSSFSNHA